MCPSHMSIQIIRTRKGDTPNSDPRNPRSGWPTVGFRIKGQKRYERTLLLQAQVWFILTDESIGTRALDCYVIRET